MLVTLKTYGLIHLKVARNADVRGNGYLAILLLFSE